MKVNLSNVKDVNGIHKINNNKFTKPVSFKGCDEFIKTTAAKTFNEAKDEIQQKYKSSILELANKLNEHAQKVIDIYSKFSNNGSFCKILDETHFGVADYRNKLYLNYKDCNYKWKPTGKKDPNLTDDDYLCFIKNHIEKSFILNNERPFDVNKNNFIMIQSKDKETSERFIDYLRFSWEKQFLRDTSFPKKINHAKNFLNKKALGFTDFVTVKDFSDNPENLCAAVKDAVNKAQVRYTKTGRGTILRVDNMQSLLKQGDRVENCLPDFGISPLGSNVVIIFSNTDPNICPANATGNYVLDVLNNAKDCVCNFHNASNTEDLEPYTENMRNITNNYIATKNELHNLTMQYKNEIADAKVNFSGGIVPPAPAPTPVPVAAPVSAPVPTPTPMPDPTPHGNKLKNSVNKVINKVKENKKAAIIIGVIGAICATFATLCIISYNKKVKSTKQKTNIPESKSYLNKTLQQAVNIKVPDIFSEFAKLH